ncbi:hypothetical protein [Nostoc sp.]
MNIFYGLLALRAMSTTGYLALHLACAVMKLMGDVYDGLFGVTL